jgi:ABC-type polysaccharide/polyol phosphate export permease
MKDLVGFLKTIYRYRFTIWLMAVQEIRSKYAGSVLGGAWSIIHPIVLVFIYWVVFSIGFKVPPPNNIPFLSWFFCAFVAWQAFSESLLSGSNSILKHRNLIKKTVFPAQILPLVSILSSLINSLILIALLLIVMMIQGVELSFFSFQIIYYLLALSLLSLGGGWFFSAASVLLRDMSQILNVILQLLFWVTPIFYRLDMFPAKYHIFWKINPLYYLTEGFRNSFLYKQPFWAFPKHTLYFWAITLIVVCFGGWFFKKARYHLADNL